MSPLTKADLEKLQSVHNRFIAYQKHQTNVYPCEKAELQTVVCALDHIYTEDDFRSGIKEIDFSNETHLHLLNIARSVDDRKKIPLEERPIALTMKGRLCRADVKVAKDQKPLVEFIKLMAIGAGAAVGGPWGACAAYGAREALDKSFAPRPPLTVDDIQSVENLPLNKKQELYLSLPLDQEAEKALLGDILKDVKPSDVCDVFMHELDVKEMIAKDLVEGSDETEEGEEKKSAVKEKPTAGERANKFIKGFAKVISQYHALEKKGEKFRNHRKELRRGFENISAEFKLNIPLERFSNLTALEINQNLRSCEFAENFEKHAQAVNDLSKSFLDGVLSLRKDIRSCTEDVGFYQDKVGKLTSISQSLGKLYNEKLKTLEKQSRVFNVISTGLHLISTVTGRHEISAAADVVSNHFSGKQQRALKKYSKSLDEGRESVCKIGALSQEALSQLLNLQATTREEQVRLFSMRSHLLPDVYRQCLEELSEALEDQKKQQQDEIGQEKNRLNGLRRQKTGNRSLEDQRKNTDLDAQIHASERRLEQGQQGIVKLDGLLQKNAEEQKIAEHLAPLTKQKAEAIQNSAKGPVDPLDRAWQSYSTELLEFYRGQRENKFRQTEDLFASFGPMVNLLKFFSEKCDPQQKTSIGNLLANAPAIHKITGDFVHLQKNITALEDFYRVLSTTKTKKATTLFTAAWEHHKNDIIPHLIIPSVAALGGLGFIIQSIYLLNHTTNDPHLIALAKMGEDLVKIQQEMFRQQMSALIPRLTNISLQISDSTTKITDVIRNLRGEIIYISQRNDTHDYTLSIDRFAEGVELTGSFDQLLTKLDHCQKPNNNGATFFGMDRLYLPEIANQPDYFTGFLAKSTGGQGEYASLCILETLVKTARKLYQRDALSAEANAEVSDFVTKAGNAISKLQDLSGFPHQLLERTLTLRDSLPTGPYTIQDQETVRSLPNSGPLQNQTGEPLGSQKFVRGFFSTDNATSYDAKAKEMFLEFNNLLRNGSNDDHHIIPCCSISQDHSVTTPLMFPKDFLIMLDEACDHYRNTPALATQASLALTSYAFRRNDNGYFELVLQWNAYSKSKKESRVFVECVVATFDELTVGSFKGKANEFLIQAMHCGKHGLGLPGKGTVALENGSISPREYEFPGLFACFAKAKHIDEACFNYNSQANTKKAMYVSADFVDSSNTTPYSSGATTFPQVDNEAFFSYTASYENELAMIFKTPQYQSYITNVYALQALIRLNNNIGVKELESKMIEHFGLYTNIGSAMKARPRVEINDDAVTAFGPSKVLEQKLNDLKAILAELKRS